MTESAGGAPDFYEEDEPVDEIRAAFDEGEKHKTERERAAYYEAHRDDPDEWGDGVPTPPSRRRLASMISVRLTPDEAAAVRHAAACMGMSLSAFLRTAALARANGLTGDTRTEANGLVVLTLVSDLPKAAA